MPRQTWMSVAFCLACATASCRSTSHREMLETKLRQQEDQLTELSSRLNQTQSELLAAQRESNSLRRQLHDQGQTVLAAEQLAVLHRATEIRIQSWLTGGVDRDGEPGDDGLRVLVVPVDATGDTLRVPGTIEIELIDLSQPKGEQTIAQRQFLPQETSAHWHRGFLGTGYLIELNWERIPTQPDLTLNVKLTTPDGRLFHATHFVQVDPPQPTASVTDSNRRVNRPANFESHAPDPELDSSPQEKKRSPNDATATTRPVHTSDRFTEETMPRLR